MATIIGSARSDERGRYSGGASGDQRQTASQDYKGEVSMQPFYAHPKGWVILRPKSSAIAMKIGANMITACNNRNIGYDQGNRLAIIRDGINSQKPTECDYSSLVRECIKEASGVDPGNFTTSNEATMLLATGLFTRIEYVHGTPLYVGDVLVTKTKGHTVIVTDGVIRINEETPKEPEYRLGDMYTLRTDLAVRSGAGSGYYQYKAKEFPAALAKKDDNNDGRLDKGCQVRCHAIEVLSNGNIWIRVLERDYWVLAYNKEKCKINIS